MLSESVSSLTPRYSWPRVGARSVGLRPTRIGAESPTLAISAPATREASGAFGACRPECTPQQDTVAGPDGNNYRVDSYVRTVTVTSGRDVKRVTVVVRRANDLTVPPLARLTHRFDLATGCLPGSTTTPC